MNFFGHPVQDPGVDIFRITCDMQCSVELKNKLFIPINSVRAKVEQSCIMKHTEDWGEVRQGFHVHVRNMLMVEDFVFVKKQ